MNKPRRSGQLPAGLVKHFYFWRSGKLEHKEVTRASIYGSFGVRLDAPDLVLAIEETPAGPEYELGPAGIRNPHLVQMALIQHRRRTTSVSRGDLGRFLPHGIAEDVSKEAEIAARRLVKNFAALGAEERQSGVLTDRLNEFRSATDDGWQINILVQGFSSVIKEPVTGADIGVVIEIIRGDESTLKALWIQAKRVDYPTANVRTMPDLVQQLSVIQRRTDEAYGLVYGPTEVYAVRADDLDVHLRLNTLFEQAVRCERGDLDERLVADSFHKTFVIEVAVLDATATDTLARPRQ